MAAIRFSSWTGSLPPKFPELFWSVTGSTPLGGSGSRRLESLRVREPKPFSIWFLKIQLVMFEIILNNFYDIQIMYNKLNLFCYYFYLGNRGSWMAVLRYCIIRIWQVHRVMVQMTHLLMTHWRGSHHHRLVVHWRLNNWLYDLLWISLNERK